MIQNPKLLHSLSAANTDYLQLGVNMTKKKVIDFRKMNAESMPLRSSARLLCKFLHI